MYFLMKSAKDLFWPRIMLVLLSFPFCFSLAYFLGRHYLNFDVRIPLNFFLASALGDLKPEGFEHYLYFISVLVPLIVFTLSEFLPAQQISRFRFFSDSIETLINNYPIRYAAILLSITITAIALLSSQMGRLQTTQFSILAILLLAILLIPHSLLAAASRGFKTLCDRLDSSSHIQIVLVLISVILTGIALLPSYRTNFSLPYSADHIGGHFPFIYGEFAAPLNGRTSMVDFFPQYQNILPMLVVPYFRAFGLTVGSFATLMIFFSLISLMAVSHFLRRFTGPVRGFIYYAVFLGLAFAPMGISNPVNSYTYYPNGPLRCFFPYITSFLLWKTLHTSSRRWRFTLLVVSTLGFLNNMDFGLACWAATLATLFAVENDKLTLALELIFAFAAELFAWIAFSWIRSGEFFDPRNLGMYQKAFGYYGLTMLPIEPLGWHWAAFLVLISAALVGLFDLRRTTSNRIMGGMLSYCSLLGFASGMYFVGRSHPNVLVSLYGIIGLNLILLFHRTHRQRSAPAGVTFSQRLLLFGMVIATSNLGLVFRPIEEFQRIISPARGPMIRPDASLDFRMKLASIVRSHSKEGSNVEIVYRFGYEIAERAGVQNRFPFAQDGSVALISQVDLAMSYIIKHRINEVYGRIFPEMAEKLKTFGFRLVTTYDDFEVWKRT